MAQSLTEPEFKQCNTNELLDTEVLTQIGFEAKFFKFDPSTIIACFRAENHQKHGYRGNR